MAKGMGRRSNSVSGLLNQPPKKDLGAANQRIGDPSISQQVWMFKKSSLGDLGQHQAGSGLAINQVGLTAKQLA